VVTRKAKENIFKAAKDCGLDTGSDIEGFYQSQHQARCSARCEPNQMDDLSVNSKDKSPDLFTD
jgi:hypothetical protein